MNHYSLPAPCSEARVVVYADVAVPFGRHAAASVL